MPKFDFLTREMEALAGRVQKEIFDKRSAHFLLGTGGSMTTAIISDPAIAKYAASGKRVALNHPTLVWYLESVSAAQADTEMTITLGTTIVRGLLEPLNRLYIRKDGPFRQNYTNQWALNKRVLIVDIAPANASVDLAFQYSIPNDPNNYIENISWPSMERSSERLISTPAGVFPPGWNAMSAAQKQALYAAAIGSGKVGMGSGRGSYQPATPQQGGNLYQPNRVGNIPGALSTSVMAPNQTLRLSQAQQNQQGGTVFTSSGGFTALSSSASCGPVILPPGHKWP